MRALLRSAARALIYRAPGEATRCPACASVRLFDLDLLSVKRAGSGTLTGFVTGCESCGLVFSNPLPSAQELDDFYRPDGAWNAPRDGDDGCEPAPIARGDGAPVKRGIGSWGRVFESVRGELIVDAPPPGARVLDFGCGSGDVLDALQDCGWETWGIEPATDLPFRRHRRLEAIPGDARFDLVIVSHVLEHVTDPLAVLKQLAAACRPRGLVLVGTPRFDTLPVHRDYKYVINGRAHVTAYTWPCLEGLLARAGLQAVASPPELVSKGGGRETRARLRVLARRTDAPLTGPPSPAAAAREAIRRYYREGDRRTWLERAGLFRIAARRAGIVRARAARARRAAARL